MAAILTTSILLSTSIEKSIPNPVNPVNPDNPDNPDNLVNPVPLNQVNPANPENPSPDTIIFLLESVNRTSFDRKLSKYFRENKNITLSEHFFIPVPHTSNSIYSLLTGKSISSTRPEIEKLPPVQETLPGIFKKNGYSTHFITSSPIHFENINDMLFKYFDEVLYKEKLIEWYKNKGKNVSNFTWGVDDKAILDYSTEILIYNKKPIFAILGFSNTHSPYWNPDTNKFNRNDNSTDKGRYLNAIEYDIYLIDRIMDEFITKRGNAIRFILISDHGESFGERGFNKHNYSIYNSETDVPFLIYDKTNTKMNSIKTGSLLDLLPSMIDLYNFKTIEKEKSFFRKEYKLELRLNSWNSNDYKGYILEDKKWIYKEREDLLLELNLDETSEKQIQNGKTKNNLLNKIHGINK
jgi:phosphoglycerol transferase MdoB-like AlkP superfamily enzyme